MLRNTLLYDFYSELLTERQKNIYHMYYNDDMTLAEIADRFGISRQAVNFSLKQAQKNFESFENALKLVERHSLICGFLKELRTTLEDSDYTGCITVLNKIDDLI